MGSRHGIQDELLARAKRMLHDIAGLFISDAAGALEIAKEVLEIATAANDKKLMGRSFMEIGKAVRQKGDLATSLEAFQQAAELFETIKDNEDYPKALQAVGTIHSAKGELALASGCFERALPIAQANEDYSTLQRIWNSWGIVFIRVGDYEQALHAYEKCLELLQKFPDPYLESSVLTNLGAIFRRSGEHPVAKDYFFRALAIGRDLADNRQIASTLIFLGETSLFERKYDEARSFLRESVAICEAGGFTDNLVHSLKSLAELASATGQDAEALHHLNRARNLLNPATDRILLQKVEQQIGAAYFNLGQLDKAHAALQQALELAQEINSPQLLYEVNVLFSELAAKQLDYKLSHTLLRAALEQQQLLFSQGNQKAIRDMEVRIAIDARKNAS